MNRLKFNGNETALGGILNQTSIPKVIDSTHPQEVDEFLLHNQTIEEVKRKGDIFLHGNIILENEGFIVYQLPKTGYFYIYSKKITRFISGENYDTGGKSRTVAFKNIMDDDTGKGIYLEVEPDIWMHLSNEMKALDFEVQRNSNGEKTYLFKAPSGMPDIKRRLFADTMGSGKHIPSRSRFANIIRALNADNGEKLILAINTDIILH